MRSHVKDRMRSHVKAFNFGLTLSLSKGENAAPNRGDANARPMVTAVTDTLGRACYDARDYEFTCRDPGHGVIDF